MMVQLHCAAVAGRVSPSLVSAECKSQSFDMRFAVAWVLAADDASSVPASLANTAARTGDNLCHDYYQKLEHIGISTIHDLGRVTSEACEGIGLPSSLRAVVLRSL